MASGCFGEALSDLADQVRGQAVDPVPGKKEERIYMDELTGELADFDGSRITLAAEDNYYHFDVSQAVLECRWGMLAGQPVSVIYEGRLTGTDTSQVKVLKVADQVHKKTEPEIAVDQGVIQEITCNAVKVQNKDGRIVRYPITGTEQYYEKGLKKGGTVYIRYTGKPIPGQGVMAKTLDADHVRVLSVSDVDPLNPGPAGNGEDKEEKTLSGRVAELRDELLTVIPDNSQDRIRLNLSGARVYFQGGFAPGTHFTAKYKGELKKGEEVTAATEIQDDNPALLRENEIQSTVIGTVTGATANTVTLKTDDGVPFTCNIAGAKNRMAAGPEPGQRAMVTFRPAKSGESNIYTGLKIEDAY